MDDPVGPDDAGNPDESSDSAPQDGPQAVLRFLDERDADLLAEAETLVGYDTRNPPGETRDVVAHLRESLDYGGVETDVLAREEGKPNLLVTIPGERPERLLFVGHLDTVPFDPEAWRHDPLGEWVESGPDEGEGGGDDDSGAVESEAAGGGRGDREMRLYGRGATDMKGAVAAMATVARAFAETGTVPPVGLRFAFVSDEETGGEAGFGYLLDRGALSADACVVGETTCERGRYSVAVADRGSVWLTLEADGVAAHGSRPALGVNAIDRLYGAVDDVRLRLADRELALDPELGPVLDESVAFYAPRMGEDGARETFEYPTVNLGTLSGGEAVNTVPTAATAEVDVRVTASASTADVLAAVEDVLAHHEGVEIADVSRADGTYESPDSPLVAAVAETAADVTGDRVYRRSATGGGDAKKLRNAGVPTVEFGLGTDTAHAVDEYTTATALRGNAAVYARLPFALRERWDDERGIGGSDA